LFAGWLAVLAAIGCSRLLQWRDRRQQGDSYRIIYIHVPSAWMAMFPLPDDGLLGRRRPGLQHPAVVDDGAGDRAHRRADGLISLWTGALWGGPDWGRYWVWDARLTSTLILLFLYLGFIALQAAIRTTSGAPTRPAPCCGMVGVIPGADHLFLGQVVGTLLHQGASVKPGCSSMADIMLTACCMMGSPSGRMRSRGAGAAATRSSSSGSGGHSGCSTRASGAHFESLR